MFGHQGLVALAALATGAPPTAGVLATGTGPTIPTDEVIHALDWVKVGYPRLRLFKADGAQLQPADYLEGRSGATWQAASRLRARRSVVEQRLSDGGMLVLDEVDQVSAPVGAICAALRSFTALEVWANLYINTGAPGFPEHVDAHDVLVVAGPGHRQWDFVGSSHLLCPGDVLIIPEGTRHSVQSPQSGQAVHLSFAIERPRPSHLLDNVSGALGREAPVMGPTDLRRSFWSGRRVESWMLRDGRWQGPVLFEREGSQQYHWCGGERYPWRSKQLPGHPIASLH